MTAPSWDALAILSGSCFVLGAVLGYVVGRARPRARRWLRLRQDTGRKW